MSRPAHLGTAEMGEVVLCRSATGRSLITFSLVTGKLTCVSTQTRRLSLKAAVDF